MSDPIPRRYPPREIRENFLHTNISCNTVLRELIFSDPWCNTLTGITGMCPKSVVIQHTCIPKNLVFCCLIPYNRTLHWVKYELFSSLKLGQVTDRQTASQTESDADEPTMQQHTCAKMYIPSSYILPDIVTNYSCYTNPFCYPVEVQ